MANSNPVDSSLADVTKLLGGSSSGALNEQLTTITQQLQQLQGVNQTQIETLAANTAAVAQNSSAKGGEGSSTAGSIGSTIESALGFGLGLSPLISGLVSLFGGGGGSSTPAPLVSYVAPLAVNLQAGIRGSTPGAFGVDTADGGLPRAAPSSQITVQVQAMDSQSFLDHSDEIAAAVRQAMLQSSTLSDVIRGV